MPSSTAYPTQSTTTAYPNNASVITVTREGIVLTLREYLSLNVASSQVEGMTTSAGVLA